MMPAWGHPTAPERFLHGFGAAGIQLFWRMISQVVRFQIGRNAAGTGPEGRKRLAAVLPSTPLLPDLRSAAALEPTDYFRRVSTGDIATHCSALERFEADGVRLADGTHLPADCFACAVIDEQGREVPITEAMIQQACRALDQEPDEDEPTQG